ncbi:MAG: hypothetical protein R2684_08900 [Pyrinomonadaceae bacterium]
MVMKIVGVVIGFIVWTLIFIGGEQLVGAIAPSWVADPTATYIDSVPLLSTYLVRSVIASFVAGLVAALIAKDNNKTPLILGIILLIVGVLVQAAAWNLLPAWYNIVFVLLLVPTTLVGGKVISVGEK